MATGGPPYTNPLRPRITIKTLDGEDTLYTYNAFDTSHTISVAYIDMENAMGENGTFNMTINDHNNEIGKDNIHNVKVFLELGKTESTFHTFLIGFGDIFNISRPGTNAQFYNINGYGTGVQASRLFISRREKYRRTESGAKIYNIVDNALTKRLWRPLKTNDDSIQDITGWSKDGISTKVNTPLTVIDKSFVYFSDLLAELCDITGAVWFIDFKDDFEEVFTFKHNVDLHTPIVLKSGDLQDKINDDPNTISYIKTAFNVEDNTTTEGGVATRLFTSTTQDKATVFEISDENVGATSLTFRALAQQVIIDNDARRIDSISLELWKKGDPSSPNDRVNGDIVLDNGSNKPSIKDKDILDEFHIGLSSIENNAQDIDIPVDISPEKLDVAQSKIWIRLFQRSNEEDEEGNPDGNGDPNHGTEHTVMWNHNNKLNTTQAYYSGSANEGDANKKSSLSWNTTNQGPLYEVKIFSNLRRLFARTNGGAVRRLGLREVFVPTDFLDDPGDVTRYLSLNLSQSSKGRRGIGDFRVTVPLNFLFKPYQWVAFNDGLSEISDAFQVQRARYICNSGGGDDVPLGTLHAEITLSGLYNSLISAGCSCL